MAGHMEGAALWRALSLADRVSLIRTGAQCMTCKECDVDHEIELWQGALEHDPSLWEAKLASLEVSEMELRAALVIAQPLDSASIVIDLPSPTKDELADDAFFAGLISPFLERLSQEIQQGLDPKSRSEIAPLLEGFVLHIEETLRRIAERCAILELNVARILGETIGETPEARFHNFGRQLGANGGFQRFFETYPVLARVFCEIVDQGVENFRQFCGRLSTDFTSISEVIFGGQNPGPPIRAQFGLSDRHRAGQTVAEVTFRSGVSLIYKPRPVDVDLHLSLVHTWINARIPDLDIWSPRLLAGGDGSYGWMETVSSAPCATLQERERFFVRQGAHLAIFHALGGTDLHRENLIACGEQPVYVDVEALMHPRLTPRPEERSEACLDAALSASVLATGLLPAPFGQQAEVDLSGLAGRNNQRTPYKVLQWRDFGTDHWRYERRATLLQPSHHTARDEIGREVPAVEHVGEITRGFVLATEAINSDKAEFAGLLRRFAHDPVRVVARATSTYGILLQESTHPNIAKDALGQDRLFDELWLTTRSNPLFARLVASEQRDLRRFDIPIFSTSPSSTSLFDADGKELIHAFTEPGLEIAKNRLASGDEGDLKKQLWLIEASCRLQAQNEGHPIPAKGRTDQKGPLTQDRALAAAVDIGDHLLALGYSDPSRFWLTAERVNAHKWKIARTGHDLYSGLPGIALFLDALARLSGEARFRTVAVQSINTLLEELETTEMPSIGLYTGLGGVIYTLAYLSKTQNDLALAKAAQFLIPRVIAGLEADRDFDITDGAAGAIIGLAALLGECPEDAASFEALTLCANHLVKHATAQTVGIGWHIRLNPKCALSGMAHGSGGIAWALSEAWALTTNASYKSAVEQALAHEQSLFDPARGNWADLREDPFTAGGRRTKFMASWCHGAPGIALSRIGVQAHLPSEAIPLEIDAAFKTTMHHLSDDNHSLCHGLLGNLDCLMRIREWSGQGEAAPQPLCANVQDHRADQWRCGIPVPVQVPGLMLGLAGIGYGLLRLARPEQLGSLLMPQIPTVRGIPTI